MKFKHKKIIISSVAVTVAGVLGVSALLQTSVSVQASPDMMPGIEEILNEKSADKPFRILEIVDNKKDAEIGWYVSGQEPYIKLYEYTYQDELGNEKTIHFDTLEEGLSKLPTRQLREEFAGNFKYELDENGKIKTDENGNPIYSFDNTGLKNVQSVSYKDGSDKDKDDYPLSYTPYSEKYFLSQGDDPGNWKQIDLKSPDGETRTDKVTVKGEYQENTSHTGDYTKQDQSYYPVRNEEDKKKDSDKLFQENIQNFYASEDGAVAPYYLKFTPVSNSFINDALNKINGSSKESAILPEYNYENDQYGLYENVYTELTQEIADNLTKEQPEYTFPGENEISAIKEQATKLNRNQTSTAASFSAQDVTDFSDQNGSAAQGFASGVSSEIPEVQEDLSSPEAFSADEFSSEQEELPSSGDNLEQPVDNFQPEPAGEETEETSEIQPDGDARQPLISPAPENAISASNPYVYLEESIETYPYHKYEIVSDLATVKSIVDTTNLQADQEKLSKDPPEQITRSEGDITCEDGQYWYWKATGNENELTKVNLFVVSGRQPVAYEDIREIPTDFQYNYYYKVSDAYFCCKLPEGQDASDPANYEFYGWYYPMYPENQDVYLPAGDKTPTYYISDAEYKLTPGTGDYDFIPDDNKPERTVEVNHLFFDGGYVNHDWLKRYVFHLSPDDSETSQQFQDFHIQVDTRLSLEFASDNVTDQTGELTSEVAPMVSEAGVDLVSIEKEFSDDQEFSDQADTYEEEFGDDSAQTEPGEEAAFSSEPNTAQNEEQNKPDSQAVKDLQENYDLIYINGSGLSADMAGILASSSIPCIINVLKVSGTDINNGSTVMNAFKDFVKEDTDGHYVNQYVYFFKNTFTQGLSDSEPSLLNLDFHTDFNVKGQETAVEGFEEILDYIEQENQFRKIGTTTDQNSSTDDFTDETQGITDGTNQETKVQLLSNELSQARAIEYIINYKHKRALKNKDVINVLEIEPEKINDNKQLKDENVLRWLGYTEAQIQAAKDNNQTQIALNNKVINSVKSCCEYKGNPATNVLDKSQDKIWDHNYNTKYGYQSSTGFIQKHNGDYHWLQVYFEKPSDINQFEYTPRKWENGSNWSADGKLVKFTLEFYNYQGEKIGNDLDGCFDWKDETDSTIKLYQFKERKKVSSVKIYFKSAYYRVNDGKGEPVIGNHAATCAYVGFSNTSEQVILPKINITHMTASEFVGHIDDIASKYDMIYIGDKKENNFNSLITGSGSKLYSHVGSAKGITLDNYKDNPLYDIMGLLNSDWEDPTTKTRFASVDTYSENGSGYFRGSGNDMTPQQCKELINFVKSGYPVILGQNLFTADGQISSDKIDKSSYYYQFIKEALNYSNVFSSKDLNNDSKNLMFFSNLAKPVMTFQEMPKEPPRVGDDISSTSTVGYIDKELKYVFSIENDSEISSVNTTYDCNVYIDLNFDGVFSTNENQRRFINIMDSYGNSVPEKTDEKGNTRYELRSGEQYTLIRKIPENYYKLITWKLEVSSNLNSYIHTSRIGYAKQNNTSGKSQIINVLQIYPEDTVSDEAKGYPNGTWKLTDQNGRFWTLWNQASTYAGFDIKVVGKTVTEFSPEDLNNTDILIIGFDDCYPNIPLDKVTAILNYIKSGRSVIFSHDNLSAYNYDQSKIDHSVIVNGQKIDEVVPYNSWMNKKNRNDMGIDTNPVLRYIVGMDRYGITCQDEINDTKISDVLKSGSLDTQNSFTYKQLLQVAGDIAFKADNEEQNQSYVQTQGYTNVTLEHFSNIGVKRTVTATKVNDGAITQFPFKMNDSSITVASTHGQYYQLALEQDRDINGVSDEKGDIVVWYCLSDNNYYKSPNDARNNYYFYSKGNIIYTGAGHSPIKDEAEIKLFINAIVAAANVTAVQPDVHFVKSFNPAAPEEKTRYYMTDQSTFTDNDPNTLEKDMDFYINVKDYNMVSLDNNPTQDMTLDFYIEDDTGSPLENTGNLPADLQGKNLKWLNSDPGFSVKEYGTENTFTSNDIKVQDNGVYSFTVKDIEQYLKRQGNQGYKPNCKIYVRVKSTVTLYGQATTSTAWASIDLKQRQLFDLD